MNFIDRAFEQNLAGDDFLQAMTDIYSEPEVYKILNQYPPFVADVISIIDYDTALQMDGLDDIISGNLSSRYTEILNALKRCGAEHEADILSLIHILQSCSFFLNIRNRESAANSSNLPKTIHRPCYILAHNQMRNNFTKKMDVTRAYNPTK